MDEEEIKQKLFLDPDGFFDFLETRKIDISGLKSLDLLRLFIRERYKELFKQENFEAAEAIFWLSYFAERELRESILFVETQLGKNPDEIDARLDEMTFGKKIIFIQKNYNPEGKSDKYIEALRVIKNLRNDVAHGRIENLKYGRYSLADIRGQMKLTIDLMNGALNK